MPLRPSKSKIVERLDLNYSVLAGLDQMMGRIRVKFTSASSNKELSPTSHSDESVRLAMRLQANIARATATRNVSNV